MSVKVKGLNEAIKALKQKGEKAERAIIGKLEDTASDIEINAKQDAPYDILGEPLAASQKIKSKADNNGLFWRIGYLDVDFSIKLNDIYAWAEFGTGLSARSILSGPGYTAEMRAQAFDFIRNGKGRIIGKAHLFPAYIRHTANLVEEIVYLRMFAFSETKSANGCFSFVKLTFFDLLAVIMHPLPLA